MSLFIGVIGLEQLELNLELLLNSKNCYTSLTVASTNINQLNPNLVKIDVTLRSGMSLIIGLIRPEQLELFTLELESSLE